MLLRDIELINNNFVNLSNKFLEITKTTQSSDLFTPNKMLLNYKLNTEYVHKTPKYLSHETETVSQKILLLEKQILDLNEHNHYLSKQTQDLMKQKEDVKQKLIVSDYEHKLQLKDLINSCISNHIETKTCCKKTHNNTLNKNNTINNNGTLNVISINQYISEICSGAPNINKVKGSDLGEYYIKNHPEFNMKIFSENEDTQTDNDNESNDNESNDNNTDITLKICSSKKHTPNTCPLKKLCIFGYPYENMFINIFNKNSSKRSRNNNLNIKCYANKISDIITFFFKKEDNNRQSIWNTNDVKQSFIVKISENNKNKVVCDKDGIKINEYTIKTLIKNIYERLEKYKDILNESIDIIQNDFIKKTHKLVRQTFIKNLSKKNVTREKINEKIKPIINQLIEISECICYNKNKRTIETMNLNTTYDNTCENYTEKIKIIEMIQNIINNKNFSGHIKKNLSKHYYISQNEMKNKLQDYSENQLNKNFFEEIIIEPTSKIQEICLVVFNKLINHIKKSRSTDNDLNNDTSSSNTSCNTHSDDIISDNTSDE